MLLLIDDVQFRTKETFLEFISRSFGKGSDGINDIESLKKAVNERGSEEIEFVFYDFEEIVDEVKDFANEVVSAILDCRIANQQISVVYRNGADGI